MNKAPLSPNRRLRRWTAAAALTLGLVGAAALVLGVKRPEVLSSGAIGFGLGILSLIVLAFLIISSLGAGRELEGFSFVPLDALYAAAVVVPLASFLVASRARENFLQPYMLVTGCAVYLLVRTNRHRLRGGLALVAAGGLALLGGLEAVHGLVQGALGSEMKGFFFNLNHLAMFLAMVLPAAWAFSRLAPGRCLRFSGRIACLLMLVSVIASRCRTSYAALALVAGLALLFRRGEALGGGDGRHGRPPLREALVFVAVGLVAIGALALSFKPKSASGRLFVWKVTLRTAVARPVAGIGYGNFPAVYNVEQGRYFREVGGTPAERLSASPVAYAFNDYLEAFMETGAVGLLALVPFWGAALLTALRALRCRERGSAGPPGAPFAAGVGGSVLSYMIIAAFYYPSRILPLALLFPALLGWIADDGLPPSPGARRAFRGAVVAFGAVSFVAALIFFPTLRNRYAAEQEWSRAIALSRAERTADAVAASRAAYRALRTDGDLVDFHSVLLLGAGDAREAANVLERARAVSSNPRLAERLAAARLELGDLDGALAIAREADAALPWRLTSKSLLADIHLRRGEKDEAARHARLVLETPMKVRTTEGEGLKSKAFDLLDSLGIPAVEGAGPVVGLAATLPAESRGGTLAALQQMEDRSGPFIDALRAAGPEERKCLAFLLANMPDRDVRSLAAADLVENVRLALLARRIVPLAADVPERLFLEEVLPYAVVDEPRDPWRADFYARFREAAAASPTVEEAVMRLSRETLLQFRLVYQDRNVRKRIPSPRRIAERRIVSCGEASLMLVDALRAVGLPARLAVLPRYRGRPGGHIWVEAWDRDRWRHVSAYDPSYFDRTWIQRWVVQMFPDGGPGHIFAPRFARTGIRAAPTWDVNFVDISKRYLK
jgi:O-antigen ligase